MNLASKGEQNFLVLWGPSGTGKTHVMAAMIEWVLPLWGQDMRVWKESDLYGRIRDGMSRGFDFETNLQHLMDYKVLFIDDLGSNRKNEFHQEVTYILVNERYNANLPTILSTNYSPPEISQHYGERISDRLFGHDCTDISFWGLESARITPHAHYSEGVK